MKEFPRFTDSTIQFSITQHQMKLVIVLLSDFYNQLEADDSPQKIKAFIDSANKTISNTNAFTMYSALPEKLLRDVDEINEILINSFVNKKMEYVDMVRQDLNAHFEENYDREIFDLADGEMLKIADSSSVYG